MLQGWYWDYDKDGCNGCTGPSWASRLQGQAATLVVPRTLSGGVGSETVIVAINFGNGTLKVDQEINLSTNVNPGAEFTDLTGNAFQAVVSVDNANRMLIDVPARSYAVYILSEAALPATLTQFDATLQRNGEVRLDWTAEEESGLKAYVIECSSDNGRRFQAVTEVRARNAPGAYTFIHSADWNGPRRLYRLRMVDLDGTEVLSPLREVRFTTPGQIRVFPNPADRILYVETEDRTADWQLYSSAGRLMPVRRQRTYRGWTFYVERLPAGVYALGDGNGRVKRVVIE
jgi:alpha-amylase